MSKFNDRGEITITLAIIGNRLEISIKDTGPGIREEHREKLFTAFSQIEDAKTKTHEGTGLGLTISKKLAELMGGTLSVASIYGDGTTFSVSLASRNMEHGACMTSDKKKILVVDDDELHLYTTQELL